jgi:hypothetical protein
MYLSYIGLGAGYSHAAQNRDAVVTVLNKVVAIQLVYLNGWYATKPIDSPVHLHPAGFIRAQFGHEIRGVVVNAPHTADDLLQTDILQPALACNYTPHMPARLFKGAQISTATQKTGEETCEGSTLVCVSELPLRDFQTTQFILKNHGSTPFHASLCMSLQP